MGQKKKRRRLAKGRAAWYTEREEITGEGTDLIGIIAALDEEIRLLDEALTEAQTVRLGGLEARVGRLGEQEVAVMRCGVGKVAAAAATQAVISAFDPAAVINTGCAGALAPGLAVGDVVLAVETAEWDMDTTALGDPRGYITGMDRVRMETDAALRACLRRSIPSGTKVVEGLIVSGDAFVSAPAQRAVILGAFPDALCAEMEGAAVGHVCAANGVPFCVIRTMSDTADGGSATDFPAFFRQAGAASAAVLMTMFGA